MKHQVTLMLVALVFTASLSAWGQGASDKEIEAAICAGNWKELAAITTDTAVGHTFKAIANGVIWEWRIMDEERSKVRGDRASIDKFCKDILQRNPANGFVRFAVATHLIGTDDAARAIEEYKKAMELAPTFAASYYQLGAYYGLKRNWTEQMAWMDKAIKIDPRYSPAYVGRGMAYKETGRLDLAAEQFKKAVEVLEENKITSGEQLGRAAYNWGWILVNRPSPDNDQAITILTKAIKADPLRFEAYNELGIAYKRKGQFPDAIKTFKEGINKGDTTSIIYFNLGVSEYRNGNNQGAQAAFKKAISLDPNGSTGSTARQWLGRIQ